MGPGFTVLLAGGVTSLAYMAKGDWPPPRIFIGSAIAGTGLMAVARKYPGPAQQFASLILLTALVTSGVDVAQGLNRALGAPLPTDPKPIDTTTADDGGD